MLQGVCNVFESPRLVVVPVGNVGALERSPIHKTSECLPIVVIGISFGVMTPYPPTILRLDS